MSAESRRSGMSCGGSPVTRTLPRCASPPCHVHPTFTAPWPRVTLHWLDRPQSVCLSAHPRKDALAVVSLLFLNLSFHKYV